ncbi:hypothetical protein MTO96_046911 [Rhipicephalus appendiculatus]
MEERRLVTMSRSDSEYTTTTSITHTDGVYTFSTTTGTTYTTDDTRSVGFVPAAATADPKKNVSLGQLTYIVKSSEPSAAPDKAASRDEPLAERHAGKFEGQRRAAQSLPPPKLPPAAPTPEKRLPKGDGQPKTTPQEALGVVRTVEKTQRTAESSAAFTDPALLLAGPSSRSPIGYSTDSYFSSTADSYTSTTSTTSTYSGSDISYWESDAILRSHPHGALDRMPAIIPPGESKPAEPPKSTAGAFECALRDVATSTDALLDSSNDNRGKNWMG